MAFVPGDEVHVAPLGKGVVREVRNGGRYLVELKGRSIVAAEGQLTIVSGRKRPDAPESSSSKARIPDSAGTVSHVATSLDLHGMTVEEAVAALDTFLNAALARGSPGRARDPRTQRLGLRAAVHARLKQLRVVRAFRLDAANAGMTIVTL